MVTSIGSSVSALQAFSKQMDVSANNVANVYSDEFKKSRVINTEYNNGGVKTTITKVDTPGPLVENPLSKTSELKELSNTDIAEEIVNQIVAEHGFNANAQVIKSYEETTGFLIDLIG